MPLIIPKLDGSAEQEWIAKLMGKTLTDGDNSATVSLVSCNVRYF